MSTTVLTHGQVTWTNIVHPTKADVQELGRRYPAFHPLNLEDCLTELEIPKLDAHDDYLFLVVQMPVWDPVEGTTRPAEVDIFITKGVLVTSHRGEMEPLNQFFARADAEEWFREELMGNGASPLLYRLLNELVDYCFPLVENICNKLNRIEAQMFQDNPRPVLLEVARVRRNIISMRSVLRLQVGTVDQLIHRAWPFIHEELDPYWGDLGDHLAQLCRMLDEYAEVIGGLADTIDTLASHRIDEVMRLLTIVTVITLPLTLLATIFGMNILMPYSEHPLLFYFVIVLGVIFTIGLVWYLRRRRWW